MRFWDSSAMVALIVPQALSRQAEQWLAEDAEIALWTLTPVEALSALRRLVRDGLLAESAAAEAEALAGEIGRHAHVVIDVDGVKALALRLLRTHPLRAADALQLAAAIAWADGDPQGTIVHTFDRRLTLAARHEGFLCPSST